MRREEKREEKKKKKRKRRRRRRRKQERETTKMTEKDLLLLSWLEGTIRVYIHPKKKKMTARLFFIERL